MEVTMGMFLTLGSIIGLTICIIALIVTFAVFPKQRRKLLEKIEME